MKDNNFNLMRLFLSLSVMFTHSYAFVGSGLWIESYSTIRWGTGIGGLAVHVFFVISGYLITFSYLKQQSFPVFAAHRILRLAPALVFAALFSQWAWSRYNGYAGNAVPAFNGSLWTLNWEAMCYVAVGVLGVLGMLSRRNFNIFFVVLLLHYFANIAEDGMMYKRMEPLFMFFAMGAFIALNEQFINMKRAAIIGTIVTICSFAPFIIGPIISGLQKVSSLYIYQFHDWRIHNSAYIFSAPFAVIYIGRYARSFVKLKTDISYGVYIYAWPVAQIVVYKSRKMGFNLDGAEVFFIALVPVLVLSFASAKMIEEPALRLKRLFTNGASLRVPAA